nr:hypothetical protein [Tanacetum cinerariifolium]
NLKEEVFQAILTDTPNVDPATTVTFMAKYEALFDNRYFYVDKPVIAEGKKGGDKEEEIQNNHSTSWIVHTDSSFICNSFRVGNVGYWWNETFSLFFCFSTGIRNLRIHPDEKMGFERLANRNSLFSLFQRVSRFEPRPKGFSLRAKKEWGLYPKMKVRVLHTASWMSLKHQELVSGFFSNASQMLTQGGEVHIAYKDSLPFNRWNIQELALCQGLRLQQKSKFDPKKFYGYAPKKGNGQHIDGEFDYVNSYNFQCMKIGLEAYQEAGPSQTEEGNQEVHVPDLFEGSLDYLTIGDDDQGAPCVTSVQLQGRVIEGTQTLDLFSMEGGVFRIKSVLGRPGKTDWIERRCLYLFFIDRIPIICSLFGEGDKGEGPNMFYPQPLYVISNLNTLFLFTSTMRATTSIPLLVREKASAQGLMKSQQLVRTRFWLTLFVLLGSRAISFLSVGLCHPLEQLREKLPPKKPLVSFLDMLSSASRFKQLCSASSADCQPVQPTSEDSSHPAQHVYSRQRLQSLSQGQTTPQDQQSSPVASLLGAFSS